MILCRAPAKAVLFIMAMLAAPVFVQFTPSLARAQEAAESPSPFPAPIMENDSVNYAQSGSIKLTWRSAGEDVAASDFDFVLQEATNPTFADAEIYYRGPDMATYISGLPDGTYYYRVRLQDDTGRISDWSQPIVVEVRHQSLSLAWFLFAVGGLVFGLTVAVVVSGTRKNRVTDSHPAEKER